MSTLGEEFPKEQKRVRELLVEYEKIPTGAFGAMVLRQVLERADKVAIGGDVVAMLRSFEEMKGCE